MARPIKATPILKGEAANIFLDKMLCQDKKIKIPSKKVSKIVEEEIRKNEFK